MNLQGRTRRCARVLSSDVSAGNYSYYQLENPAASGVVVRLSRMVGESGHATTAYGILLGKHEAAIAGRLLDAELPQTLLGDGASVVKVYSSEYASYGSLREWAFRATSIKNLSQQVFAEEVELLPGEILTIVHAGAQQYLLGYVVWDEFGA